MVDTLRLLSLTGLDRHELAGLLPNGALTVQRPSGDGRPGTGYEPGTITAILLLTPPVLAALSTWLLKKRHRRVVELETETVDARTGVTSRTKLRIVMSESSSQADVITALGEQLGVSAELMTAALEQQ